MEVIKPILLISTYNWPSALDLVLKSVMNQSVLPHQVVIADDGSKDETIQLIKNYQQIFPVQLIHVWHEDNGFRKSIVLNKAIKSSTGNYIIQIDGDIILHKHFIKDHLKHAKKGYFIKGSRGRLIKSKTDAVLSSKDIKIAFWHNGILSRFNIIRVPILSPLLYGDPLKTRNVKGCNFAFWKEDAFTVNGFNNSISGWGHEDIEFAARLVNAGKKRMQLKLAAVCFHLHHDFVSRNKEQNNLEVYYSVVRNKIAKCDNGIDQV